MAANRHIGFGAKDCFFEFKRHILAQVGAALGTTAAAGAAAKEISETKKVPEDFADVVEYRGIEPAGSSATHGGVPEAVVGGAFIGVGQDGVGLAAFFEFLFGGGIVGIAIRMKLQRQFAICALDLLLAGFPGNPKNFVVVAFYVASQNGPGSFRVAVLVLGVARYFHHRGAQQAVFQLVAALQFFEYLMIFGIAGFNHLDGLVKMGIKSLAFGGDRAKAQF